MVDGIVEGVCSIECALVGVVVLDLYIPPSIVDLHNALNMILLRNAVQQNDIGDYRQVEYHDGASTKYHRIYFGITVSNTTHID